MPVPFLHHFNCFFVFVWRVRGHDAVYTEVRVLKVSECNMQKSFKTCRLSFVIIGNGLRFMEHWGPSGGGMTDWAVLHLSWRIWNDLWSSPPNHHAGLGPAYELSLKSCWHISQNVKLPRPQQWLLPTFTQTNMVSIFQLPYKICCIKVWLCTVSKSVSTWLFFHDLSLSQTYP